MVNAVEELNSPGKLTTWSNIGSGGGAGAATNQIRIIPGKTYSIRLAHYDSLYIIDV